MASYYVNRNAQDNGDHEVHLQGCYWSSLLVGDDLPWGSAGGEEVLRECQRVRALLACLPHRLASTAACLGVDQRLLSRE